MNDSTEISLQDRLDQLMHDIRTPLQAAKLRTELLLLDCSDGELEEQLNGILDSIDDAVSLVQKHD